MVQLVGKGVYVVIFCDCIMCYVLILCDDCCVLCIFVGEFGVQCVFVCFGYDVFYVFVMFVIWIDVVFGVQVGQGFDVFGNVLLVCDQCVGKVGIVGGLIYFVDDGYGLIKGGMQVL